MSEPQIHITVTTATVCALPEDHPQRYLWEITVERTSVLSDRWAVRHGGMCLDAGGGWVYEPALDDRTHAWLDAHRHDWDTAYRLACQAAPDVIVDGLRAADLVDALEADHG